MSIITKNGEYPFVQMSDLRKFSLDDTVCCLEVRVYDNYPELGGQLKYVLSHEAVTKMGRTKGLQQAQSLFATRKMHWLGQEDV